MWLIHISNCAGPLMRAGKPASSQAHDAGKGTGSHAAGTALCSTSGVVTITSLFLQDTPGKQSWSNLVAPTWPMLPPKESVGLCGLPPT
jgi:hypothetical protein